MVPIAVPTVSAGTSSETRFGRIWMPSPPHMNESPNQNRLIRTKNPRPWGSRALDDSALTEPPRTGVYGALARNQYNTADNMTDSLAALKALVHNASPIGETLLQDFYQRWQHDALVMDKWLALQATSPRKDTLERVRALMDDPVFSLRNPNKIRALIGAFSRLNPICFHAEEGSGYQFLADQVLAVDRFNPQVAARLVGALNGWRGLDEGRAQLIRTELKRIVADGQLSRDVFEIANKALAS